MKLVRKTFVTTIAGATAQALTASAIGAEEATIIADSANADPVYLGDSTVTALTGVELVPTASYNTVKSLSLNSLYIIGTASDKVRVIYTQRA